jgi:hypothetical protein
VLGHFAFFDAVISGEVGSVSVPQCFIRICLCEVIVVLEEKASGYDGSCEYIELVVADSREEVVLQFGEWIGD